MCQAVRTETFGVKDDIHANDIAAFVRRGRGDFVIGKSIRKVNTTFELFDNHPRMILSSGSRCKSDKNQPQNIRASTVIDFICDPSSFGSGQPRLIAQLPPGNEDEGCAYQWEADYTILTWLPPKYACPISESGIVWTLFVTLAVIFLALLLTYTVLGTLYNRFVLQLRGVDQIPQFSLESMRYHASEAIDWAKDVFYAYQSRPAGSSGFFGVPNTTATNPVSHQTSVGINIRGEDLESRGGGGPGGFARPQPGHRTSGSAAFSRAPQRPIPETNPVSHQTQVNAELEHQRIQSLSQQRSPHLSQTPSPLSASSSHSSGDRAPLVTVSQSPSPPLPPVPLQGPQPQPPAVPPKAAVPPTPATANREFQVGNADDDDDDEDDDDDDDEDEDEQDYNEYNQVDDDAKELSDFKRPPQHPSGAAPGASATGSTSTPASKPPL
ncbi:hypothetical protein CC1G_00724 [Coprinopsis cinerea okayama7|uniref:Autophagy-related protein 27 n=1 Tax=Coprinopsis cinerea (strain Okayama-7 / 130 / ATCC MYA-4618 / FGSC 9003) TaxID=240176 RepID=A8N3G8_COPC7|nr:hypothetical protein CC1G_00724 [Coprinopsis cinerea okayama7\|eukprot:XP_001829545.2 hypothetical protein CC1G_00724 [Coprinopsis cinerea okayama7\